MAETQEQLIERFEKKLRDFRDGDLRIYTIDRSDEFIIVTYYESGGYPHPAEVYRHNAIFIGLMMLDKIDELLSQYWYNDLNNADEFLVELQTEIFTAIEG